jgi:phosphatidylserine/phosphatidylglycerophosphate/cardiolipin synthase-like enzyme
MRVLSSSKEVGRELQRLMDAYSHYRWAVAWGSYGFEGSERLLKRRARIERLVVGTHFYQTHPDLIAALMEEPHTRFVLKSDGVFHPKVYFFHDGAGRWECILGSSNFTAGGLGGNDEMAVLLSNRDAEAPSARAEIEASIERYWKEAKPTTAAALEVYRHRWQSMTRIRSKLGGAFGPTHGERSGSRSA